MANSPTLNLTMMASSQAQKEVVFNEFLIAMDALFRGVVKSASLTTPPTTPADGDCYIIPSGMHGEWVGKLHHITFFYNGWQYVPPKDQMRMYDQAGSVWRVYHESTSSWDAEPASVVSVLHDLTDVAGAATDGMVLTFVGADGKWEPKSITFPPLALNALSDVTFTEDLAHTGKGLAWNNTSGKWEAKTFLSAPPSLFTLPDVSNAGASENWLLAYHLDGSTPSAHFINPLDQITVSSLDQVGDVSYPLTGMHDVPAGAALLWTGAAWAPSSDVVAVKFDNLIHGPGTFEGNAGMLMRVNAIEDALEYVDPAEIGAAATLVSLTDVDIVADGTIDGQVVYWDFGHGKWKTKALAPVAVTGTWASLTGKPTLSAVATSGAYGDLSGRPTLSTVAGTGNYNDLLARPFIPNALTDLADVAVSEGSPIDGQYLMWDNAAGHWRASAITASLLDLGAIANVSVGENAGDDGKVLYWNNASSQWKVKAIAAVATSGAYSDLTGKPSLATVATTGNYSDLSGKPTIPTTLHALTDVNVSEGAGIDGYVLKWDNASSKWVAAAAASSLTLAGLSDVQVLENAGEDGKVLMWNLTAAKWKASTLDYSALTGKPALATVATTGNYNDLGGKPTIPGNSAFNLSGLGDCNMSTGAGTDGYVVYWDNASTKFKLKAAGTGGGGGSSTLSGDTDVAITSPADGQVLTYEAASSKWKNKAATGGTGGPGLTMTRPTLVQHKVACGGIDRLTLDAAPTPGNLLIVLASHWSNGIALPTGWTTMLTQNGGTNDGSIIGYKLATSADTAVQLLNSAGNVQGMNVAMFEVSGFNLMNPILAFDYYQDLTATSKTLTAASPFDKTLTLGMFATTNGSSLPFLSDSRSVLSALTTTTATTGSGQPRSVSAFRADTTNANDVITGAWGAAANSYGYAVVLLPTVSLADVSIAADTDVQLSALADNQVLQFDAATSKWKNTSAPSLPVNDLGNAFGSVVIDVRQGETQTLNVTGNITDFTITHWGDAGTLSKLTLILKNTGAFTVALPSAKWAGGAMPTVTSGAGKTDVLTFFTPDAGTTLYGNVVGQNYY